MFRMAKRADNRHGNAALGEIDDPELSAGLARSRVAGRLLVIASQIPAVFNTLVSTRRNSASRA